MMWHDNRIAQFSKAGEPLGNCPVPLVLKCGDLLLIVVQAGKDSGKNLVWQFDSEIHTDPEASWTKVGERQLTEVFAADAKLGCHEGTVWPLTHEIKASAVDFTQ